MTEKCSCGHQTDRPNGLPPPSWNLYGSNLPKGDEILIKPLSLNSINTEKYESAMKIANFHCNCKYLWLRELHGLTAFMMSNSLTDKIFWAAVIASCMAYSVYNTTNILYEYGQQSTTTLITILPTKQLKFPTMVFCPRNPDFINYYNVLQDMYSRLGYMENTTNFDIIRFSMTGFGFDNAGTEFYNATYQAKLFDYYTQWRGNRSQYEMFDFVYNTNGYTCNDMFQTCYGGSQTYNCCDIFEPTYVMLRGRCFRLTDNYYQNDTDEVAKVSIFFNNMTSPILDSGVLPQLVLYNADSNLEVGVFPRYYLNSNDWNRVRYQQKSMVLLPNSDRCSTEHVYQGKSTCFVYKWLMQLIEQFNCTVPYYKDKLSYLQDVPICEADVMVANFHNISLTPSTIGYKCTPACSRIENNVQLMTSIDYDPDPSYMFRIEASFTYLEYEQYKEIRTTSTAGFISELGGQTGLFVGSSVMTLVQLFNSIVIQIYKMLRDYCNKKAIRVRIGLFKTLATEPADKHYPPIEELPYPLETIIEVDEVFDADGLLLEESVLDEMRFETVSKWDETSLTSSTSNGTHNIITPSSMGSEISSISSNQTSCQLTPSTFTSSGSEPHDTIPESPEDVKLAKFVWIRGRIGEVQEDEVGESQV